MIFPRNDHLKITMYANSVLGVWPYIFQDNPNLRKAYQIYSKLLFYYFILFLLSALVQLYILVTEDELRVDEIGANLSITLLYPITVRRVWVVTGRKMRNLIKKILATEDVILQGGDEDVLKIYKHHVRHSQVTNLLFIGGIAIQATFYFTHPLSVDPIIKFNNATNETKIIKALPMSSWLPYDAQEHYELSYLWHVFNGFIGASYVTLADIFTFSIIIFPLGQIRVLLHVLSNYSTYVLKTKQRFRCSRDEASFLTLRECMVKHKEIISYLEDYNDTMKNIMVLDFLQSSLQLASVVIQLIVTQPTFFNVVFYGEFIVCMIIRLLVYYWYANEIMLESINVSTAAYECGWYDEPQKVKQMLLMMILRSNKPLGLEIGPFTTMTLNTFLGIIKTTYSYMMIMYR